MVELAKVTGMVIKAEPYSEYDRRLVILTLERGKITCFAKGARKMNNRFLAATNPFCFGEFGLFEGRSAYSLNEASISNYFEKFRDDFDKAMYGTYFLEVMDYFTRENNDERQMLGLLYQSLRALCNDNPEDILVRYIFELRCLLVQGLLPEIPRGRFSESAEYTLNYVVQSSIEKLFTFKVSDEVLGELKVYTSELMKQNVGVRFKSLDFLETI